MDAERDYLNAEIEVLEDLYKHARFLRTSTKQDPRKAMKAAEWEIRLKEELDKVKGEGVPA